VTGGIIFQASTSGEQGLDYVFRYGMTDSYRVRCTLHQHFITIIILQQEALTGSLYDDYLFSGGYKSENTPPDDDEFGNSNHVCNKNQFGYKLDEEGNIQLDVPSTGSIWNSFCMETKYRTFVTLQQMLEFAFIGEFSCIPINSKTCA
jgi:hypothetical protein